MSIEAEFKEMLSQFAIIKCTRCGGDTGHRLRNPEIVKGAVCHHCDPDKWAEQVIDYAITVCAERGRQQAERESADATKH